MYFLYLLHVQFILKVEDKFRKRKSQSKKSKHVIFFIYSIKYSIDIDID